MKLTGPVRYRGVDYRGAEVEVLSASGRRARLNVTVTDGKNREIRNMCASVRGSLSSEISPPAVGAC